MCCLCQVPGAWARSHGSAPSERFSLARDIPSPGYALVHEQRIDHTLWAAYLYSARFEGRRKICVSTASVLDRVYFEDSWRCGQLWPGGGTDVPVRAFIRRDSTPNPFSPETAPSPELFGIFLLAPQVRSIEVRLAGGASFKRATQVVSSVDTGRLELPEMRYATMSVRSEKQIESVIAFGADGSVLAAGRYRPG